MAWKFYKSAMYGNIDATIRPSYTESGGPSIVITDSLGATIATLGVVPDLIDTKPGKRIKLVYAGPDNDVPKFGTAFIVRSDVDFVAFLGHTARECFPGTIGNVFDLEVPINTTVEPTKLFSGFLGKGRPFLDFDGVDDRAEKDSATILPTTYPFALEAWVRTTATLQAVFLALVDKDVANIQFAIGSAFAADGTFVCSAQNTATKAAASTGVYNDGLLHHVMGLFISATSRKLYVDGVLDGTNTDSVTMSTAIDRLSIGRMGDSTPSLYFNGDVQSATIWNREPSTAEITARFNGGIIAAADQWGSQTALNVSNLVNDGGGFAYDTLERVGGGGAPNTATEFHAITDGTGSRRRAGTADEIALIAGVKYGVFFNLSLASGTAPFYDLRQELNGNNSVTDDGPQGSSAGNNYFEFTASSTVTAVMQFYSTTASEYTMTLLNVIRLGAVAEYAPDGINEDDGKWYDTSSNGLDGTNSGVVYRDTPNGTDEEFSLFEIDEVKGAISVVHEINATALSVTGTFYFGQVMAGKSFIPIAPDLNGQDNISEAGTPLFQSHGGQRSANKRHDKRGRWTRTWSFISEAEKTNWENFLEGSKEFPFLFTPDDTITSGGEPIFYLGRVVNDYTFTQVAFDVWSLTLTIEEEL